MSEEKEVYDEIRALQLCVKYLDKVEPVGRARVVKYLNEKYNPPVLHQVQPAGAVLDVSSQPLPRPGNGATAGEVG